MDISKLKVADLKKELKARGLSTLGTKNELVERLQEAATDEDAGDNGVIDNDDLLDEDAVLADESEECILEDGSGLGNEEDSVLLTPTATTAPPIPTNGAVANATKPGTVTKKLVLNRKAEVFVPSVKTSDEPEPETGTVNTAETAKGEEKKVLKLGVLSAQERAKLRAEKFGIVDNKKTVAASVTDEKLLKRQARFGIVTANEVDAKKQKRAERFGLATAPGSNAIMDEKKRKRAERFGLVQ